MAVRVSDSRLENVPTEIFDLILSYLDDPPPSFRKLLHQPTSNITESSVPWSPIKSLSLTSRGLREAVLAKLFRHARQLVPATERNSQSKSGDISLDWSEKLSDFVSFIRHAGLHQDIQSFTLVIEEDSEKDHAPQEEDADYSRERAIYESRWRDLFQLLGQGLRRLTLVAPPYCLGLLTSLSVKRDVLNEFHMEYHILSFDRGDHSSAPVEHQIDLVKAPEPACMLPTLFTIVPWESLLLNEGSFLRRYSELSGVDGAHPPSIIYSLLELLDPLDPMSKRYKDAPIMTSLHSLAYISVYPPISYFEDFLNIVDFLPSMRRFFFQTSPLTELIPDPNQRSIVDFSVLVLHLRLAVNHIFHRLIVGHDRGTPHRNKNLDTIECGNPEEGLGTVLPMEMGPTLSEYLTKLGWELQKGGSPGGRLVRIKKKATSLRSKPKE